MPKILNRSEETWDFGTLRVPPGETVYADEDIDRAHRTTCMGDHVVGSDSMFARYSKFVLVPDDAPSTALPVEPDGGETDDGEDSESAALDLAREPKRALIKRARELGIESPGKMTKAELVHALLDHPDGP